MADEGETRFSEKSAIDRIAVFSRAREFEKARTLLTRLQLPFVVLSPDPGYSRVGAPALICDSNGTSAILSDRTISCAGGPITSNCPPSYRSTIQRLSTRMFSAKRRSCSSARAWPTKLGSG